MPTLEELTGGEITHPEVKFSCEQIVVHPDVKKNTVTAGIDICIIAPDGSAWVARRTIKIQLQRKNKEDKA